jgi:hypothetical protein
LTVGTGVAFPAQEIRHERQMIVPAALSNTIIGRQMLPAFPQQVGGNWTVMVGAHEDGI